MSCPLLRRGLAAGLVLGGIVPLVSGCALASDAGSAVEAPLVALPDSDVVVETNLKSADENLDTGASAFGDSSGTAFVAGPSTGAASISESTSPGGATVLAAFNPLSDDCLGLFVVPVAAASVLGESQPGTYYYWNRHSTAPACDAASFAASVSAPSGWPAGDPSASQWPAI